MDKTVQVLIKLDLSDEQNLKYLQFYRRVSVRKMRIYNLKEYTRIYATTSTLYCNFTKNTQTNN